MKSWASWNRLALAGAIVAAGVVVSFNVLVDPYSSLKTAEWMRHGYNVNERFRKIEFLRHNIGRFDSFILGSSTMGLFPVEPADRLRPGHHWYNLSFLAGTPPDALRALKYLRSQGQEIREVVYGIDIFAFRKVEKAREMWKRDHPLVDGSGWWDWYKSHLFASSFLIGLDRVEHQFRPEPKMLFDTDGTGQYHLLEWERDLARDPDGFVRRQIYAPLEKRGGHIQTNAIALIPERFDELRELKDWLDAQGIRSHFWINPMHWATLASIEPASLSRFRELVAGAVGDVPDYSLREDFTHDDHKFYEMKHFRPSAAALILAEVLSSPGLPASPRVVADAAR